jgi:transcriptional regulator with XRE-family HTH domain
MNAFAKGYGSRLRAARTAKQVTQGRLGAELGLAYSSIANVEAGKQGASAEQAVRTAAFLDVDLHWLLTGEVNETWANRCIRMHAILTDLVGDIRDAADEIDQLPMPEVGS